MQPPPSPRLFLIDGYALIYRAFFALIARPLTTSRGENTSAAWGIVNFLKRLRASHRPEYLAWVHDAGLSFRHERYPAYKATREKLTDELQADFDTSLTRIVALLDAYHIPVVSVEGFEADDVIGTLAAQAQAASLNTVIVSGDKDFQQLVAPDVWLLNPGRGGPAAVDEHWVGMENASERLGVPPERVTDYLALVGDSSDNVPGVKGIGEKTAVELINAYGTVEEILAHAAEITKKRPREALLAQDAEARLSKELVTIRRDVPIALALDQYTPREPDHDRLRAMFVELEFHSLAKEHAAKGQAASNERAASEPAPLESPSVARTTNYMTVDSVERLREAVARARAAPFIAIDTETTVAPGWPIPVDPMRSTLIGISIAVTPDVAYYFPFRHRQKSTAAQGELMPSELPPDPAEGNLPPLLSDAIAPLRELIEDRTVRKTAQNGKYDLLVLRRAGVAMRGLEFDTMLASYVLDPGRRSHGLDMLALEFLQRKTTSYDELTGRGRDAITFDLVPIDAARDYSCEDVDVTLRLRAVFEPELEAHRLSALLRDIEVPLIDVLAEMEWTGIRIDRAWFATLKTRFRADREKVEQAIHAAAGGPFNINSNAQLRKVLFETLQLPVLKKTSTGPSTDASVLQELADQGHALPLLLMEYRELSKLESTYLDALPALVNPDTGRLHTNFSQTVAATGRLSSSDPNLQNIPIRRELGREIRRGFVPEDGWTFVAADYSQIELRLLAHLSGDEAFVKAFKAGGDIHRQTAALIFGVPLADVTAEMRGRAKTINFATIYGQGAHALSRQLKVEHAEAKRFIDEYFQRFAGVRAYLTAVVESARDRGYVETLFGRRRYIPELRDSNFNTRAFGERTAANSVIQGSAADLIKIAMIRVHRRLRDESKRSRLLLQVHDELVLESPPDEVKSVGALVREEMENAATLSVPLVVDLGEGANWMEAKS
jgi:DNA polymerase-1